MPERPGYRPPEKHPLHLKDAELQKSPEVTRAVEREERATKEKVPQDPAARIEAYMSRLEKVFLNPDENTRERNIDLFRPKIYDALLVKREDFPESYFELQKKIARERGQPVEEIPANIREQMIDTAINDQRASLDAWIDYLSSNDAVYPPWFKYFVWKNVTKLSQFDKERGEFKKRTDSTVAPFPDIYREPLAKIADLYEQVKADNRSLKDPEIQEKFSKKFPKLYAELIQESLAASMESREQTKGSWVTYKQGKAGEAEKLFQSLENKGTGWCTAGRSTAEQQVKSGDFHVYYTNDSQGNPVNPRLAIRMERQKIGEVRGILPHQAVEPMMQEALDKKLQEFGPEAEMYQKKSADMKRLTELERKQEAGEKFTKADITFLYEIDGKIEGFGYGRDPRIQELKSKRNPKEDAPAVMGLKPEEIAWGWQDFDEKIKKAYVGPLFPGVFDGPPYFELVYTSFPEGKIAFQTLEFGGKTAKQYEAELTKAGFGINDYAKQILEKAKLSKERQETDIVRLTVKDLGFPKGATNAEIWQRGKDLDLDLCPPDVGPELRLSMKDQPLGDWVIVAMEAITDSDGNPSVFRVESRGGGRWLSTSRGRPGYRWDPDYAFAFARRKH